MRETNFMAPVFLAGSIRSGVQRWNPCPYCMWPFVDALDCEGHMNVYHFPFAGNSRDEPRKWVWALRSVRDLENPMDTYFVCESVKPSVLPLQKKVAPVKNRLNITAPLPVRDPVVRAEPKPKQKPKKKKKEEPVEAPKNARQKKTQ